MKLDALQAGESLPSFTEAPISRMELIRYAAASGDFNPIHLIDEEAERAGLPGIIAHGMLTVGKLARFFSDYLEQGFIEQYSARFAGMVFLGDVITCHAKLTGSAGSDKIFSVTAVNQHNKVVVKGEIKFRMYT